MCNHGRAGLKNEVGSGVLLAYCYFEATEIELRNEDFIPGFRY